MAPTIQSSEAAMEKDGEQNERRQARGEAKQRRPYGRPPADLHRQLDGPADVRVRQGVGEKPEVRIGACEPPKHAKDPPRVFPEIALRPVAREEQGGTRRQREIEQPVDRGAPDHGERGEECEPDDHLHALHPRGLDMELHRMDVHRRR